LPPIGTRLIFSAPPATTMSQAPLAIWPAATWIAASDDPHFRSTVMPGMVTGQPALNSAVRAMFPHCSPTCVTQPNTTSSIKWTSIPVREARADNNAAARWSARTSLRLPRNLPIGDLIPSIITTSRTGAPAPWTNTPSLDDGYRRRTRAGFFPGRNRSSCGGACAWCGSNWCRDEIEIDLVEVDGVLDGDFATRLRIDSGEVAIDDV